MCFESIEFLPVVKKVLWGQKGFGSAGSILNWKNLWKKSYVQLSALSGFCEVSYEIVEGGGFSQALFSRFENFPTLELLPPLGGCVSFLSFHDFLIHADAEDHADRDHQNSDRDQN